MRPGFPCLIAARSNAGQSAASTSRPSSRMSQAPINSARRESSCGSSGSSATLDLLKLRNANHALCPPGVNGAARRSGSPCGGSIFERSRRNRRTGARNSSSRHCSRSRQSADATTRPSRSLMALITCASGAGPFLVAEHETLLRFRCKRNFVPLYGIRESARHQRCSDAACLHEWIDNLEARRASGNRDALRTSSAATPRAAARRAEGLRAALALAR